MELYCYKCSALHEFTAGEVERIVYALQGMHADVWMKTPEYQPDSIEDAIECLKTTLGFSSRDPEMYSEFVNDLVRLRLLRQTPVPRKITADCSAEAAFKSIMDKQEAQKSGYTDADVCPKCGCGMVKMVLPPRHLVDEKERIPITCARCGTPRMLERKAPEIPLDKQALSGVDCSNTTM